MSSVWGWWVNWWPSVGLTIRRPVWPPCAWRRRSPRCPSLRTLNCDTESLRRRWMRGFILLSVKAPADEWTILQINSLTIQHNQPETHYICISVFKYSWFVRHWTWNTFTIFSRRQTSSTRLYRPVVSSLNYVLVKYECKYWMSWVTEKCFLSSSEHLYRMFCFYVDLCFI